MATDPKIDHIERSVNEAVQLAKDNHRELVDLLATVRRYQQDIDELRNQTLHTADILNRMTSLHEETQNHVKHALALISDIHPHIQRIPELQAAAADLRNELKNVSAATATAGKQLALYAKKFGFDETGGWTMA